MWFNAVEEVKSLQTALLEFTRKGIYGEYARTDLQIWWPKNENLRAQILFTFLLFFFPVMAESQVRSPSDANLDFDDATLKGKYTFKNILI